MAVQPVDNGKNAPHLFVEEPMPRACDRRMLHRMLNTAIVVSTFALVALGLVASGRDAEAYHPYNPPIHTLSQHYSAYNEEYCTWVTDGSTSHGYAFGVVRDILTVNNQAADWNLLGWDGSGYRILWDPLNSATTPCYPNGWGQYFDVQYRIAASWASPCGNPWSCFRWYNPTWGPMGHNDYALIIVFLRTNHLYDHAINHETGHALGLNDGDGTCPPGGSVMHSAAYGCTNIPWPSGNDRFNVEYISANPWP